jgi:hypothetical protein
LQVCASTCCFVRHFTGAVVGRVFFLLHITCQAQLSCCGGCLSALESGVLTAMAAKAVAQLAPAPFICRTSASE